MTDHEPLSELVLYLERNRPNYPGTLSACYVCNKALGRGGGPCDHCVRAEIARRHGEIIANALCVAVEDQQKAAAAAEGTR